MELDRECGAALAGLKWLQGTRFHAERSVLGGVTASPTNGSALRHARDGLLADVRMQHV